MTTHLGEIAALATAVCWTATALTFESATQKVGSVAANLFKLAFGLLFLTVFNYITRGLAFPSDASLHSWLWLSLSGLTGFVLGDYFLFKSYTIVGARISMLIMALAPPLTVFLGWLFLGEMLSPLDLLGMGLTLAGIALVVLQRGGGGYSVGFKHPVSGLLLALGGAAGQAVGLVLTKYGMGSYPAFAAAQIRVLVGTVGYSALFTFLGGWKRLPGFFKDGPLMGKVAMGSAFGPFLGMSFSLLAVQHTSTGVAATIMALVPVLIIPPSVILFRQRVSLLEIIGAAVAVAGVWLLFLK